MLGVVSNSGDFFDIIINSEDVLSILDHEAWNKPVRMTLHR